LESTNTVPAYFPAGTWYDLYNHTSIDTSIAAQHLPVTVSSALSHVKSLQCSMQGTCGFQWRIILTIQPSSFLT
jgi:hypothetical protein